MILQPLNCTPTNDSKGFPLAPWASYSDDTSGNTLTRPASPPNAQTSYTHRRAHVLILTLPLTDDEEHFPIPFAPRRLAPQSTA